MSDGVTHARWLLPSLFSFFRLFSSFLVGIFSSFFFSCLVLLACSVLVVRFCCLLLVPLVPSLCVAPLLGPALRVFVPPSYLLKLASLNSNYNSQHSSTYDQHFLSTSKWTVFRHALPASKITRKTTKHQLTSAAVTLFGKESCSQCCRTLQIMKTLFCLFY